MKIVLIGSGNVATHLSLAFQKADHKILQVYSEQMVKAKELAKKLGSVTRFTSNIADIESNADLYILAIKDESIASFLKQFHAGDKLLAHTSGSIPISVFQKEYGKKATCGVFYPLQTFSRSRTLDLRKVPICIEATDKHTEKKLKKLASTISNRVLSITSDQRKIIHIAAVFAGNFSNHMYAIAENIMQEHNLSFSLLMPLIEETAAKIQQHSPAEMQTGPAKRGDQKIIRDHLAYLSPGSTYHAIYKLLSNSIVHINKTTKTKKKG